MYPDIINPIRKTTAFQLEENNPKLRESDHQLRNNNAKFGKWTYVNRLYDADKEGRRIWTTE